MRVHDDSVLYRINLGLKLGCVALLLFPRKKKTKKNIH